MTYAPAASVLAVLIGIALFTAAMSSCSSDKKIVTLLILLALHVTACVFISTNNLIP